MQTNEELLQAVRASLVDASNTLQDVDATGGYPLIEKVLDLDDAIDHALGLANALTEREDTTR